MLGMLSTLGKVRCRQAIHYSWLPFAVDLDKIWQLAWVTTTWRGEAILHSISILFRPFNSQNARGEARPEDVIINLERPAPPEICGRALRLRGMPFTVGNMASPALSPTENRKKSCEKWMLCIHLLGEGEEGRSCKDRHVCKNPARILS
jgi:hypothetical protein